MTASGLQNIRGWYTSVTVFCCCRLQSSRMDVEDIYHSMRLAGSKSSIDKAWAMDFGMVSKACCYKGSIYSWWLCWLPCLREAKEHPRYGTCCPQYSKRPISSWASIFLVGTSRATFFFLTAYGVFIWFPVHMTLACSLR